MLSTPQQELILSCALRAVGGSLLGDEFLKIPAKGCLRYTIYNELVATISCNSVGTIHKDYVEVKLIGSAWQFHLHPTEFVEEALQKVQLLLRGYDITRQPYGFISITMPPPALLPKATDITKTYPLRQISEEGVSLLVSRQALKYALAVT